MLQLLTSDHAKWHQRVIDNANACYDMAGLERPTVLHRMPGAVVFRSQSDALLVATDDNEDMAYDGVLVVLKNLGATAWDGTLAPHMCTPQDVTAWVFRDPAVAAAQVAM